MAAIEDSLNYLVYKTNSVLKGQMQTALKFFDITSEQWVLLKRLNQRDGMNQKELSIESFKGQAAITRSLDILEKKGLIERRKSANDRREYLVYITNRGKMLLDDAQPDMDDYQKKLDNVLSMQEMETLKRLLNKTCNSLISDR